MNVTKYGYDIHLFQIPYREITYKHTVNCPVDISVYDKKTDTLVGEIKNNTVSADSSIEMSVNGDEKVFYLPNTVDYYIVLSGNDTGAMNYTVSKINSDKGEVERINYINIPVDKTTTYRCGSDNDSLLSDSFTMTDADNHVIEPNNKLDAGHLLNINVTTATNGYGSTSQSFVASQGDFVTVEAFPDKTVNCNHFVGWYINGTRVSEEQIYRFMVNEAVTITAKFEVRHHYGIEETILNATCTDTGIKNIRCSGCNDSYTETIPTTGHIDEDGNGICDVCLFEIYAPQCSHMCHSTNPLLKAFWKIINFFNKLFGTNQICSCGAKHW